MLTIMGDCLRSDDEKAMGLSSVGRVRLDLWLSQMMMSIAGAQSGSVCKKFLQRKKERGKVSEKLIWLVYRS